MRDTGDRAKVNLGKDGTMQKRILRKVQQQSAKKRKESPERVRTMLVVPHTAMYSVHDDAHSIVHDDAHGNVYGSVFPCL